MAHALVTPSRKKSCVAMNTPFLFHTYTSHLRGTALGPWEGPAAPRNIIGLQSNVLPSTWWLQLDGVSLKSGDKSLILLAQEAPEVWRLARSIFKYAQGHSGFYTRPRRWDTRASHPVKTASGKALPIISLIECREICCNLLFSWALPSFRWFLRWKTIM